MKSNKGLIALCVVIYATLFILIGILFIEVHTNNKQQQQLAKETKELNIVNMSQRESAAVPTITIVNYGTINVTVSQPFSSYIQKIIDARTAYGDSKFIGDNAWDNASELFNKIVKYAEYYNIDIIDALTLVHVESDFNEKAYHKNTSATGLCQITNVCLDDFNRVTKKSYTMYDMFDANKNLEVGFWYFARLLNDEYYGKKCLIENIEDAYLAYNCGPTYYKNYKYELKNGTYKKGSYGAGDRWATIANLWAT